jgi:hypothetical protein
MRSSPMPVSIEGFGRSTRLPPGKLLELHEHEIPDLDEAVAVGVGRARRAARMWSPWPTQIRIEKRLKIHPQYKTGERHKP